MILSTSLNHDSSDIYTTKRENIHYTYTCTCTCICTCTCTCI